MIDAKTAAQLRAAGFDPAKLPAGTKIGGKSIDALGTPTVKVEVSLNGTVRIVIPGPPPGKPRMTQQDKWAKRPNVVRYYDWCNMIRAVVGDSLPDASRVAELNWTAYFTPPESWPKIKRARAIGTKHRQKPDSSNILKGLEDTLWPKGDEALADGRYRKRWDWTARLEVEIIPEPKEYAE
jgi:hypothetical protein